MKELDKVLDTKPTPGAVMQMVELRIQNLLAFTELQNYNDKGCFRFRHPLIRHKSEHGQLETLLRFDPEEFYRLHKNVIGNIHRYERYLKDPSKADRSEQYKALLQKHKDKDLLFKSIIQSN